MTEFLSWHLDTIHIITTLVIFIFTFVFITTEALPNAIAAMIGAFLLVAFHIVNQEEAIDAVDFETIGLLSGMMMTVAVMRKSGLFEYIAIKSIKLTGGSPWRILVVLSIVTAVLSAFLDNVTTVLIVVPLTFAVADTMKINPMPMLISEILFSNIGGAATLIGDPPNIMIGGATNLDFMDFIQNNTPVVLVVSVVTFVLLRLIYHKKLSGMVADKEKIQAFDEKRAIQNKRFFYTTLVIFLIIIALFITHHLHKIDLATLAIGGGFTMMMVTKQDPEEILKEVFIIIGGLEKTGIISFLADKMVEVTHGETEPAAQLVLWMSALSTTFINSIPYTATMISVIKEMTINANQSIEPIWWALSLGACLGGNGTLIGAAANIIVAGFTQKTPYPIKFKEYFKIGFPLMLVSIVITSLYLYVRYF